MRSVILWGVVAAGLAWGQEAPRVVVVGVDGATQDVLGPFGGSYREHHDDLIRRLDAAGVRGIGFDMSFGPNPDQDAATGELVAAAGASRAPVVVAVYSEPDPLGGPARTEPNDPRFAAAGVREAAILAQAELTLEGGLAGANAELAAARREGRDPALEFGVGAWAILEQVGPYRSLVGELADATGVATSLPTEDLPTGVEQDMSGNLSLVTQRALRPQLGDPQSVTTVSYVDVLQGRVDPALLEGAIVLVGMTDGRQDVLESPDPIGAPELERVPGVYLHAFGLQRAIREGQPAPRRRRAVQPRVSTCRCGGSHGSAGHGSGGSSRGLVGELTDGQ